VEKHQQLNLYYYHYKLFLLAMELVILDLDFLVEMVVILLLALVEVQVEQLLIILEVKDWRMGLLEFLLFMVEAVEGLVVDHYTQRLLLQILD
jgi:hypothetical protein